MLCGRFASLLCLCACALLASAGLTSCEKGAENSAQSQPGNQAAAPAPGPAATVTWVTPSADYPLSTCVISGKPLIEMGTPVAFVHDGTEVQLCCKGCLAKFLANPAPGLAKIAAGEPVPGDTTPGDTPPGDTTPGDTPDVEWIAPSADYPLATCVVSKKPLAAMGAPVAFIYKGTEVQLCCKCCRADFMAEPERCLAQIKAAAEAWRTAPEWYRYPPQEAGAYVYAVGLVDRAEDLATAKNLVEARTKEALATIVRDQAVATLTEYRRLATGAVDAELTEAQQQAVQTAARKVVETVAASATIVKRAFGSERADGSFPAFGLAQVAFATVADALVTAASETFPDVAHAGAGAAAKLRELLKTRETKTPNGGQVPVAPTSD